MEWYQISQRAEKLRALNFIIGGRGIGKTYGTIDFLVSSGETFLYLRNTETQLQECATEFGNPFKRWNLDHNRDIRILQQRKHCMIYDFENPEKPKLIGYAAALSTFENMRGVDLSDVKHVIFDEFVERRTLSFPQFETFANFYETVNRNREITGGGPLRVYLLSNAQRLDNPIMAGYGVIPIIEQMIKSGRDEWYNDLLYINLPKSEVSAAKAETAHYKLTKGSSYYNEAIENQFAFDSFHGVVKRNIQEYVPVLAMDDWYLWRHKSNGKYYICRTASNKVPVFTSKDNRMAFMSQYAMTLRMAYAAGNIEFSEYLLKSQIINNIL